MDVKSEVNKRIIECTKGVLKGDQPIDINETCLQLCHKYLAGIWSQLTFDDIRITRITGGATNQIYLCQIIDTKRSSAEEIEPIEVIIRLNGFKYDFKNFDPKNPRFNDGIITNLVSESGLGPQLYGLDPSGQLLRYYKHRRFEIKDFKDNDLMDKLAKSLARLHGLKAPIPRHKDWLLRIANEASRLAHYNKRSTITSREIQTAVRLLLPGESAKHAVSEGTKAVTKYTSIGATGAGRQRQDAFKLGLRVDVSTITEWFREMQCLSDECIDNSFNQMIRFVNALAVIFTTTIHIKIKAC
ncbi:unnamed protein product, partial [Medioppia subpectinata]